MPFKCDRCNELFRRKRDLTEHIVICELVTGLSELNIRYSLKPLIKWSGGKQDEIERFKQYLPEDYDCYIEPFIGGGSLFFHLCPTRGIIGDMHEELISFYKSIKNGKASEIYDFMKENKNDEETYYSVRDEMDYSDELEMAKRFYYLRKTCFRGMMRYNKSGKFNIPFGKYKKINYEDLKDERYATLLGHTEVVLGDYKQLVNDNDDERNFIFMDPPYDSEFTDYGYCQFGKQQQIELSDIFKNMKSKCMIVIGKTDLIMELYRGYIVGSYEKKYKFKLYGGRIDDKINNEHLVITNYGGRNSL